MPTPPLPVFTYDPAAVSMTIGDQTVLGPDKGEFCSVSRDSDAYSDEVGARGDVVRVKSNDRRGTIKITLQASSPSNDVLMALAAADEAFVAGGASGVRSVQVLDGTGRSRHTAEQAWVKKIPDGTYSTEAGQRVWEIRCGRLSTFIGGTN